jgi:hypothetical protein
MDNNKFYSGCTHDRYIRNKHKITDRAFLITRIIPYELQDWINEDSLELLPLGCSFGYNNDGKAHCVYIPRHLDIELIFCQFKLDIQQKHREQVSEKY